MAMTPKKAFSNCVPASMLEIQDGSAPFAEIVHPATTSAAAKLRSLLGEKSRDDFNVHPL
jgi:hypothetical protein